MKKTLLKTSAFCKNERTFKRTCKKNVIFFMIICIAVLTILMVACSGGNGLEYTSNGDGTCTVSGVGNCESSEINIPESYRGDTVTGIGLAAFSGNKKVTRIIIPSSVTVIEAEAFMYCSNLRSVSFANESKLNEIGSSAFQGCENLEDITIPEGVEIIGAEAFWECSNLESIVIPEGVTVLERALFNLCSNLETVIIPSSIERMEEGVFYDCYKLQNVKLPNGLLYIGPSVFHDCQAITSMYIPDSVTSIGSGAFAFCYKLESVRLPSGLKSVESTTFYDCQSLKVIDIPDGVTKIGEMAFARCYELVEIDFPKDLEYVGDNFLDMAYKGGKIEINRDDTETGAYIGDKDNPFLILRNAIGVGSITNKLYIHKDTKIIMSEAFRGFYKVKTIEIPRGVLHIGNAIFKNCDMEEIIYQGTKTEWEAITKEFGWNSYSKIKVIHCTDGDIRL